MSEPEKQIPAYERDPYLRELEVDIVRIGEEDGQPFAVLNDTILYPEGGGQPADHGWLNEVRIVDVQRIGDETRHFLESPLPAGPARLSLDWERRYDHMQQHTAQHVLTAIAADRFGWQTTSFHLGEQNCDIELDTASLSDTDLHALEEAAMAAVQAGLSVAGRRVSPEDYEELEVRTRGLPEGHAGDIRLVEVTGIDRNTCGGTHVRSTAEIGAIKLLKTEPMRGGTRLHWVAGDRVRRRLAEHESRTDALRGLFETSAEELVSAATMRLDELKDAMRRARVFESSLIDQAAEGLMARGEGVVDAHFKGVDGGFLQKIGRRFAAEAGARIALLTAAGDKGTFFVLAAGEQCPVDVAGVGPEVADILGGRGGGSGQFFQGKAGSLEGRDQALKLLRDELSQHGEGGP
jgi:Ser-tRNA(Ala) deacylase AlaX